ncbi:MAG: family 16 glycoside hydrolase [Roseiflexus sp.]
MNQPRTSLIIAASVVLFLTIALVISAPAPSGQAEVQDLIVLPTVPPTPTVPPAPSPMIGVGAPQAGMTLLTEQFDTDGALSRWRIVDLEDVPDERRSLWTVVEGRLHQDRTVPPLRDPSIHETAALIGEADWSDYTISASFYDQDNANVGLVARYRDGSYYRYRIVRNDYEDRPKHVIERVVDGSATILASLDAPGYEPRRWNTMSFSVSGDQLRAFYNGQATIEVRDGTLLSGSTGVYTRAIGGMLFDDITITSP